MPRSQFSDAYAVLIESLIDARITAGVSQTELAAALGKTQPFISKIERSVRRIDLIEFCAIATALGLDPVKFFKQVYRQLPSNLEV